MKKSFGIVFQKVGEGKQAMKWRLINQTRHTVLADTVYCCDNFWTRVMGLLGKPRISAGEAYWLRPCRSVHTFGMTYPIDLYVLDKENWVIETVKMMKPNRISRFYSKASSILEFASGPSRDCVPGDQLKLEEVP